MKYYQILKLLKLSLENKPKDPQTLLYLESIQGTLKPYLSNQDRLNRTF
ncbi:hypothetical protein HanXRQr2_Chr14g0636371 [Helianthus annuus]|uniref:Uncharacterized protein n=1 Tax=Helianthus annuus TaxID=4232 RepID=A0A9K3H5W5_HELAN|nr:hypothetical protein HanXRQr2_Chr14g0636371 [Helianthus annuus]KAJ0839731.1 hypothetical protein HanPSC8_Chr14g0610321 [Helianthus annuus]